MQVNRNYTFWGFKNTLVTIVENDVRFISLFLQSNS